MLKRVSVPVGGVVLNEVILNGIPMVFLRRCGKVLLYRSRYGWCESFTEQQFKDALSPSRRGYGGGFNGSGRDRR